MWKYIFLMTFSLALLNLSKGKAITALQGDTKFLQWKMNHLPPQNSVVNVLHPLLAETTNGLDYAQLFSLLRTDVILTSNSISRRVSNIIYNNATTGNIAFTLNDIRLKDGGDYRTRYSVVGNSSVTDIGIRLIVYDKPSKISLTAISSPVEGKDMTLNCFAQSNSKPDDHGLQMKYKWYRNGVPLRTGNRYVTSGSQLQVKNIQRADSKTLYSCVAFETESLISDASAGYTVHVQHAPDPITISPSMALHTLKENDRLHELNCTSSCNPTCSYKWELDGNKVSYGKVLSAINNIKRGQAGQYVCKVTNKHGQRKSNVTVVVQYSPDKPVLQINGHNTNVNESLPITLICTTQSVPPSNLSIHGSNMTSLIMKADTLKGNLTIPHANCLDTGLFYCSAVNVIGNSSSDGINVNVLCKPRLDHRVSQVLKQVLKSGDTMNISGTLISNPQPTVYWSLRQIRSSMSKNLTNNNDSLEFEEYWKVPTFLYQASRTDIKPEQFGEYLMHAQNQQGKCVMVFTVTQKLSKESNSGATIGGAIAGGIFIVVLIILFVIFLKRRRRNIKKNAMKRRIRHTPIKPTSKPNYTRAKKDFDAGNNVKGENKRDGFKHDMWHTSARPRHVKPDLLKSRAVMIDLDFLAVVYNIDGGKIRDRRKHTTRHQQAGPAYKPDKRTYKNANDLKQISIKDISVDVINPKNDVNPESSKSKGTTGQQNVNVPANAPEIDVSQEQPTRQKNEEGLVYIDVEINSQCENLQEAVIHGTQNTEYVEIDFTKSPQPLPSDVEVDKKPEGSPYDNVCCTCETNA